MTSKSIIKLVKIPKIKDDGYLYFAQTPSQIPFDIKRIYFITDPVSGLPRGKHAHKKTRQVLFCLIGKARIILDNGKKREQIVLSSPGKGILLDTNIWVEMLNLNKKTILLVIASEKYNSKDYIRNYDDFLRRVHRISK